MSSPRREEAEPWVMLTLETGTEASEVQGNWERGVEEAKRRKCLEKEMVFRNTMSGVSEGPGE